ncbi:MAG: CHASE2 domain-containing protein [Desulfobacterales bacterium]|nr:CHASE2 domain-containing protein [Desulfobacterales bacterium]
MKEIPFKKIELLIGLFIGLLYVLFSFQDLAIFESFGRVVYGIQMRLDFPRSMGANKIAIVNIDEKSLRQLGSWPWPRQVIGEMINVLKNNGARLIGLDFPFNEKEQNQGLLEVRNLQKLALEHAATSDKKNPWLLDTLKEIEKRLDNDSVLCEAIKKSGNVYLPVIGAYGKYDTDVALPEDSVIRRNALKVKAPLGDLVPVTRLTTPFLELSESIRGLGHLNLSPRKSQQGYSHLLLIDYRGYVIPSLPFRLSLDYLGKTFEDTIVPGKGVLLSDKLVPTATGEVLVKYRGGKRSFPYYSFADILNVKKVPAVFDGKIVLIGYTAEGAPTVSTPVDPALPQVEFMANVIDNLINGNYLKRPAFMPYAEALILLLLSVFASYILPRQSALNRMGVTVGLVFVAFLVGLIFFTVLGIWFKIIYVCLALLTIFVVHSIRDIVVRQKALGITSRESVETNRMLGLSLQSQGLLDLAFEKFRKCPLDDALTDVVYNLGLDYERKRMYNKAISV